MTIEVTQEICDAAAQIAEVYGETDTAYEIRAGLIDKCEEVQVVAQMLLEAYEKGFRDGSPSNS